MNEIPVCNSLCLSDLLENKAGLAYVRALLNDMKAKREQIIKLFEILSGKKVKKIRFWTSTQSFRKEKQVRSVCLYFGFGRFVVNSGGWFDNCYDRCGFSRGVLSDSAKQSNSGGRKFKINGADWLCFEEKGRTYIKKQRGEKK